MNAYNDIIDYLKSVNAILFGSRAFGVHTDKSDYDYLIPIEYYQNMLSYIKTKHPDIKIDESDYYLKSFYLFVGDTTFNIVVYKRDDKDAWLNTIAMLKALPKSELENKNKRQLLFETILAMLKKTI